MLVMSGRIRRGPDEELPLDVVPLAVTHIVFSCEGLYLWFTRLAHFLFLIVLFVYTILFIYGVGVFLKKSSFHSF